MQVLKRSLVVSLVVLLLAGFATFIASPRASAQAAPDTTIFTFSFVGQEIGDGCTGETVLVTSGEIQVVVHSNQLPNGDMQFDSTVTLQDGKAVGETSGIQYEMIQANSATTHETSDGFADQETVTTNGRLVAPGPGNNSLFHEVSHITFANGQLTAVFDHLTIDCQ
ncbi:MAG TPA: hypothetical protein VFU69_12605 [Ktedonobacterales bacterium]|nr:hypothetical protein [Ktedonobacterales bacterium]